MLSLLGAFCIVPLLLPWLVSRLGARAFYFAALLPIVAFVQAAMAAPAVLNGDIPFESYSWISALGIEISLRMDTLSWVLALIRSEEHTSELQSLMRISYAVFCLKKTKQNSTTYKPDT